MKFPAYLVPALAVFTWVSCSKHDSGPGTSKTGSGDTTELLVKVSSPEMADSTLFLYTQDSVLRGFAHEYNYIGTPKIDGYFPVYANGHFAALNKGTDTLGASATMLFNFLLDGSSRVQLSADVATDAYYDSLGYNAAGQLAYVYEYSGTPAGVRYISSVSELTWDANGNVTQFNTADNLTDLQAANYTFTATMTYDGHVNPYRKTQAALLMALVEDADYYAFLSAQNVATAQIAQYDAGSTAAESDANTYTYDAAGNPLSVTHAVTIKGSTVTTHQYFTYIPL
jgi:YD repeat-containing protein